MTIKELKEMIHLMEEHGLMELEVEKEGLKIRLKREPSGKIVPVEVPLMTPSVRAGGREVTAIPPVGQQKARETEDESNIVMVRSPMVGTLYSAPAPDAVPYVTKGKNIAKGDVLCIIEAMKLMNEIKSDIAGILLEILIENGQPVEFDQALFKIQKG
jgi:acetyl-CoA carboxylase biotin carboxyl carrier protein